MIVLDTSFIVDLLRGKERAQEMLYCLEKEGESICTTSINVLELYRGAFLSKRVNENLITRRISGKDRRREGGD